MTVSKIMLIIYLITSFSGHRPTQRECARTGFRSHARCHPYPIPPPVKVDHTTRVYDPYSFWIVMCVLLDPVRTNHGFLSLSEKTRKCNHLEMSLQRQHILLSYLKTLCVGPAGVLTCDLPLSRLALSQPS